MTDAKIQIEKHQRKGGAGYCRVKDKRVNRAKGATKPPDASNERGKETSGVNVHCVQEPKDQTTNY